MCGLKDCHVLTFSSSGSVVDHLALHPQLETGNFIIKAVWLPGSQTQLALVTADFVKVWVCQVSFMQNMSNFSVTPTVFRVCMYAGPGKYLNFSLTFSRTGKSFKLVGDPEKSW